MDNAVTDSLSLELHAGVVSSLPRAVCELAVVLCSIHTPPPESCKVCVIFKKIIESPKQVIDDRLHS